MSFTFRNLKRLGSRVAVTIPTDEGGLLGRECPEKSCLGYFKLKPGTGLVGEGLPCHCPYCGHSAASDQFWTKEQVEYAQSQVFRKVSDAFHRDLKQLEFNKPARGAFGIGMSLKVTAGHPVPIRHYREKALETHITCAECTLQYAIYGVFAFCPDCRAHNSSQILEMNLSLVRKQVSLCEQVDDAELRRRLLEDALENCVSSLDGFGREACRVRAEQSTAPGKCESVSFQNIARAAKRVGELFGVDLQAAVAAEHWELAQRGFMKRHVVSHRAGVVDQQYLDETNDPTAVVGRLIPLEAGEVARLAAATMEIGAALVRLLPAPVKK